jgi:hypothetical protein
LFLHAGLSLPDGLRVTNHNNWNRLDMRPGFEPCLDPDLVTS